MVSLHPIYDSKRMARSFNALENWPNKMAPIRDQGWCGASWAITTADVASDRYDHCFGSAYVFIKNTSFNDFYFSDLS